MKSNIQSGGAVVEAPSCDSGGDGGEKGKFLPVPLACVPPENLNGIKTYIATSNGYSLYNNTGNQICSKDYHRLMDAGNRFMYISAADYKQYYKAVANSIKDIAGNKEIPIDQKSEIICRTTSALAEQIGAGDISDDTVEQSTNMSGAIIKVAMSDEQAMSYLYDSASHEYSIASHLANVSTMLVAFACHIGVRNHQFLSQLGTAGFLHDIGKIIIQRNILDFDDPDNRKDHVTCAVDHLRENTNTDADVIEMIAHHHEKADGSGYPKKLKGDAISIASRMLTVVDLFDNMTSERPNRPEPMSITKALVEIRKMAPHHLDEKVVEAFVNFVQIALQGSRIEEDRQARKYIIQKLCLGYNKTFNPSGRIYQRYYFRSSAEMRLMTQDGSGWKPGDKVSVIIYNISQGGMGILASEGYEADSIVHITLPMPGDKPARKFTARVVRSVSYENGWFTVGVEFLQKLTYEDAENIFYTLK